MPQGPGIRPGLRGPGKSSARPALGGAKSVPPASQIRDGAAIGTAAGHGHRSRPNSGFTRTIGAARIFAQLGNPIRCRCVKLQQAKETRMKGIVAYFLGIPIVIIILLYMTDVF